MERHAKLGPVEFATDGVFLCGMAHYPKPIDESIAQGQAAASRAVTLLARETIFTSGTIAETNPTLCSECGVCVSVCPYSAPSFAERGPLPAEPGLIRCLQRMRTLRGFVPIRCDTLKGFDNDQIFAQIFALNKAV